VTARLDLAVVSSLQLGSTEVSHRLSSHQIPAAGEQSRAQSAHAAPPLPHLHPRAPPPLPPPATDGFDWLDLFAFLSSPADDSSYQIPQPETEAWARAAEEYLQLEWEMLDRNLAPALPYVKSLFLGCSSLELLYTKAPDILLGKGRRRGGRRREELAGSGGGRRGEVVGESSSGNSRSPWRKGVGNF
jgi:hypothetical protein